MSGEKASALTASGTKTIFVYGPELKLLGRIESWVSLVWPEDVYKRQALALVAKSVAVDVAARALMTSTDQEPMTQLTQAAGGYSASGSFLVPGGGLFIKKSELARLGLRRQRMGVIELYGSSA